MTARRLTAMTVNRTRRMRYGPQSTRAIWNARRPRDAMATSCETATRTVATTIAALSGDSAMISIGFKIFGGP